ncbi:MAG: hypothetical protein GX624_03780 [Actinobacteria bacterium]|nr:hypothetical protein [Actinomycetota bacterium]
MTTPEWEVVGECTVCGGELCTMGVEGIRMGGIHGAWGLAIGNWSDVTEHVMKVEMLFCKECRRMELRLPQ